MSASQKYVVTVAGIAAGVAWAGSAAAAPVLESKAGANFTPIAYDGTQVQTLGSFDPSGAGLNIIQVTGRVVLDQPLTTAKVEFSAESGLIANVPTAGQFGTQYARAYEALPDTFSADSARSVSVGKGGISNFSSTPMFGSTSFTGADGATAFGYFQGTYANDTFTLLDYGTVTGMQPAPVPEPETWAMMAAGFAGIGAALRRRRKASDVEAMVAAAA